MAEETAAKGAEPSMEEILASIRQIINQNDPTPGESQPADTAPEDTDVLELTDILDEAEPLQPVETASEPVLEDEPEATMEEIAAAMNPEKEFAPTAMPAPAPIPTPAPQMETTMTDELISGAAAEAATGALGSLAETLVREKMEHSLPIGNNVRTLESMVVEAMKPLLKEWLDANLAGIVERIVQAEVEKLTKRLGG